MRNVFIVIKSDFICHGGVRAVKHKDPEAVSSHVATDAR